MRCASLCVGAAGVTLAVALSACSPALENPTDKKVDTATNFRPSPPTTSAASIPVVGYSDCTADPVRAPKVIHLSCFDDSKKLVDIKWEEWKPTGAEGTATLVSPGSKEAASVELSDPLASGTATVLTTLVVNGEVVSP